MKQCPKTTTLQGCMKKFMGGGGDPNQKLFQNDGGRPKCELFCEKLTKNGTAGDFFFSRKLKFHRKIIKIST